MIKKVVEMASKGKVTLRNGGFLNVKECKWEVKAALGGYGIKPFPRGFE